MTPHHGALFAEGVYNTRSMPRVLSRRMRACINASDTRAFCVWVWSDAPRRSQYPFDYTWALAVWNAGTLWRAFESSGRKRLMVCGDRDGFCSVSAGALNICSPRRLAACWTALQFEPRWSAAHRRLLAQHRVRIPFRARCIPCWSGWTERGAALTPPPRPQVNNFERRSRAVREEGGESRVFQGVDHFWRGGTERNAMALLVAEWAEQSCM